MLTIKNNYDNLVLEIKLVKIIEMQNGETI